MQRKVRTSAKCQLDFRETKQWKEAEVFLIGEGCIANPSGLIVVLIQSDRRRNTSSCICPVHTSC